MLMMPPGIDRVVWSAEDVAIAQAFHYPHWSPQGGSPYSAVRLGDWKLIYLCKTSSWELYNLKDHLGETENLISTKSDLQAILSWFLADHLKKVDANYPRKSGTLEELHPTPLVRDDEDSDGDGQSDFQELVKRTDPKDSKSVSK